MKAYGVCYNCISECGGRDFCALAHTFWLHLIHTHVGITLARLVNKVFLGPISWRVRCDTHVFSLCNLLNHHYTITRSGQGITDHNTSYMKCVSDSSVCSPLWKFIYAFLPTYIQIPPTGNCTSWKKSGLGIIPHGFSVLFRKFYIGLYMNTTLFIPNSTYFQLRFN